MIVVICENVSLPVLFPVVGGFCIRSCWEVLSEIEFANIIDRGIEPWSVWFLYNALIYPFGMIAHPSPHSIASEFVETICKTVDHTQIINSSSMGSSRRNFVVRVAIPPWFPDMNETPPSLIQWCNRSTRLYNKIFLYNLIIYLVLLIFLKYYLYRRECCIRVTQPQSPNAQGGGQTYQLQAGHTCIFPVVLLSNRVSCRNIFHIMRHGYMYSHSSW